MKRLPLNKHAIIHNIALTTCYGIDWLRDSAENSHEQLLCLETLGHVAACRMTKEVVMDGVPTSEITDLLLDMPDRDTLEKRLVDYYMKS